MKRTVHLVKFDNLQAYCGRPTIKSMYDERYAGTPAAGTKNKGHICTSELKLVTCLVCIKAREAAYA